MSRSDLLTHSDFRDIYLLLGECLASGDNPGLWLQILFEGYKRLYGVQFSAVFDGSWELILGTSLPGPDDTSLVLGTCEDSADQVIREYFDCGALEKDPSAQSWRALPHKTATSARQDVITDSHWYNSLCYNEFFIRTGTDHRIMSRCPSGPDKGLMITLWRNTGDRLFTRRQVKLIDFIQHEISQFIEAGRLKTFSSIGPARLSPRLRQVVRLLHAGNSPKRIAYLLGISPHTCHDYMKALHRYFNVSNRVDLLNAISTHIKTEHNVLQYPEV